VIISSVTVNAMVIGFKGTFNNILSVYIIMNFDFPFVRLFGVR